MTPPEEPLFGPPRRELGDLVRLHAEEVMRRWEPAARDSVEGAKEAPPLILTDMLRETLDDIAGALAQSHSDTASTRAGMTARMIAYAAAHGSERAAVPHYDVGQVAREYRLLRHTLMEVLARETTLTVADVYALADCADQAIETAVDAFAEALREAQTNQIRGLVHDLLNPLSIVRMETQLIARKADDSDQVRKHAAQSLKSIERIASMAGALLDTSRLEAGELLKLSFKNVDLRELVKSVGKSARVAHGDRVRVQVPDSRVDGRFPVAGAIRILENLIANAAKYGDPEAEITVTLTADAHNAVLRVHNWGRPIPAEERDRIFKEFFQSGEADQPKGWGIGLAVVRSVAEASGGEVHLDSDAESGTTFTVTLRKDGGRNEETLTHVNRR